MIKRYRKIAVAIGAMVVLSAVPHAFAEETVQAVQESAGETAPSELPYAYESRSYGYRIMCPKQPAFVIPSVELDGH